MSASVAIVTATAKNVLYVPSTAIQGTSPANTVQVMAERHPAVDAGEHRPLDELQHRDHQRGPGRADGRHRRGEPDRLDHARRAASAGSPAAPVVSAATASRAGCVPVADPTVVPTAPVQPPLIEGRGLTRVYPMGDSEVAALRGVDFRIELGENVAIIGPSGSGKSTLLHILGLLDRQTSGQYLFAGVDTDTLDDDRLALLRNRAIGFIFQSFNLVSGESALENVAVAAGLRRRQAQGAGRARGGGARPRRPVRPRAPRPVAALRRAAPARRHRARARHATRGDPRRRADRQPRLALERRRLHACSRSCRPRA